jgi:hypothetical protein
MTVIREIGKAQLVELKVRFLAVPTLAIPVLEKVYYPKFLWFTSIDALVKEVSTRKPLIIVEMPTDKRITPEKVPAHMRQSPEVFCIRAFDSLPEREWSMVRSNIIETDNHNFTFKWDTDNYSDPVLAAAKTRQEAEAKAAREYDLKELQEHSQSVSTGKKRHPLLST